MRVESLGRKVGQGIKNLLMNHMDAWGVTLIIVSVYLIAHQLIVWEGLRLMIAIGAIYWFGFALNDYFDAPIDAEDPYKAQRNFFVRHPYQRWYPLAMIGVLFLIYAIGFAPFGWRGVAIYIPSLLIMWAYSARPFRLKSRPVFDLLIHGIFVQTYPYLVCLLLLGAEVHSFDYVMLIFFFLSSVGAQLEQQLRDYEVDKQHESNFTIFFGKSISAVMMRIITALFIAVIVVYVGNHTLPIFLIPLFVVALPAVLHRFLRHGSARRPERLIKVSVALAMGYISVMWLIVLLR